MTNLLAQIKNEQSQIEARVGSLERKTDGLERKTNSASCCALMAFVFTLFVAVVLIYLLIQTSERATFYLPKNFASEETTSPQDGATVGGCVRDVLGTC